MVKGKKSEKILIDIRKIIQVGKQMAVSLPRDWCSENKCKIGDKLLIKIEHLRGTKDIKLLKK